MDGPILIQPGNSSLPSVERTRATPGAGFTEALKNALSSVDDLHVEADAQSAQVAKGAGNLHETALALEKADVAMRVAMKTRNKLVDAYHEIMRMSI